MLEAVVNVSEGRDGALLARLAAACGDALVDLHADPDHNRSVFTLAALGERDVSFAVRRLARAVAAALDVTNHAGAHPRFGALDVVPFVALDRDDEAERARAVEEALAFAHWWSNEAAVPVFLYDDADPAHRTLPDARRDAFLARAPDLGPPLPHPRLGATAVGARAPLAAVNCTLATGDVAVATRIARQVRERDGGLRGVRALGFALTSLGRAQVSMNLVDLPTTGVEDACTRVQQLARVAGTGVERVELVGLLPAAEIARCSAGFLAWSGIGPGDAVEGRVGRRREPPGP